MFEPYKSEPTTHDHKLLHFLILICALPTTLFIFSKWISNDFTNPLVLFAYAVCFFAFLFITVYEWMQLFDKEI
jgi:ABC-type spermidine/putrescine transport system permease subunit I